MITLEGLLRKPRLISPHLKLGALRRILVKIVSTRDRYTDVLDKVSGYLAIGVRLVWVIGPRKQAVTVHYPDGRAQLVTAEGTITGEEVIPGFKIAVKELFGE